MSQTVCIVTDSISDIPPAMAAELGIRVVPLTLTIAGETFVDGSIGLEEFFARMGAARQLPSTSQPSVGAFIEAYQHALGAFEHVVSVHVSHRLSGTIESAREAARIVGERVTVFDTLNLSWGEGYQAVLAARAARSGASVPEVVRVLEDARKRIHMIVGLDSLDNLKKGGRIGRVSAFVGGLLNLKVMLTPGRDGVLEPVARSRGAQSALQASVDWLAEHIDPAKPAAFAVQHALSPDKAAWLEAAVRERFTVAELYVIEAGAVISTHTGTGWGLTGIELG